MSDTEMVYYLYSSSTSLNESFNSYIAHWAPKLLFFKKSYPARVYMAALDWNENNPDKFRIRLERKAPPQKGKKAREKSKHAAGSP
jgi:hypothetical protein